MLFCKADLKSTHLLCQGLDSFAATSGLCANIENLAIYEGCIPVDVKVMIAQEVHLPLGSLLFRYLGVPFQFRRISSADCDILIDKMTSRIRSWYARNLSYAGRVQLITSVLTSISSYWCMLFILLKAVIKKVNPIHHSYLWHATDNNSAPGNIGWKCICCP